MIYKNTSVILSNPKRNRNIKSAAFRRFTASGSATFLPADLEVAPTPLSIRGCGRSFPLELLSMMRDGGVIGKSRVLVDLDELAVSLGAGGRSGVPPESGNTNWERICSLFN